MLIVKMVAEIFRRLMDARSIEIGINEAMNMKLLVRCNGR